MVKPERATVSVCPPKVASAQAILVPLQDPLRTSTTASKPVPPATVTVWVAAVAMKEYQTSALEEEVAELHEMGVIDCVDATVVPLVGEEQVPKNTVRFVAPAQSSLAGGGGSVFTHTLKEVVCPAVEVYVATRMKYVCPGVSPDTVLVLGSLQTNEVAAPQLLST